MASVEKPKLAAILYASKEKLDLDVRDADNKQRVIKFTADRLVWLHENWAHIEQYIKQQKSDSEAVCVDGSEKNG